MANPTQRQIREIKVVVDTKGAPELQKIADGFGKMNRSVSQSADVLTRFQKIFNGLAGLSFAGIGIKNITDTMDSMQKLDDRLKQSTGSADGAKKALEGIAAVGKNTKASIEDIGQVYNRLSLSLGDSKISTEALLGLTNTLANTFRLSGATAAEAAAATIQLSQGLASGQLRGQELRSVLEQNALAGDILAKQFGTTRGKLLKYSEAIGGLDAGRVLQAFAKDAEAINDAAQKLKPTIGETLTVAFDDLKLRVHAANEAMGASEKIIKAINFAFGNLEAIVGFSAALYLWSKRVAIASGVVTKLATGIMWLVSTALKLGAVVGAFLMLHPAVLIVVGLGAAIWGLNGGLDKVIRGIRGFAEELGLVARNTDVDKMKESWFAATSATNNYVTSAKEQGRIMEESLNPALGDFAKNLIIQSAGLRSLPGPIEKMNEEFEKYAKNANLTSDTTINMEEALAKLNQQFLKDKNVSKYNVALKALKIDKLNEDFRKGKVDKEEFDKRLNEIRFGKASKSANELRLDIKALNEQFNQGKLTLSQYAGKIEEAKIDKLNRDLKTGKTDAIAYNEALNGHTLNEYNRAAAAGSKTMSEFINDSRTLNVRRLNQEFASGKIGVFEYNKALVETSNTFQPNGVLTTGLHNYIESAGTLSLNVANSITQTFGTLEEFMFEFTKNGKFAFKDFAKAILDDINRIIIRAMIIRPLAEGILSAAGSTTASTKGTGKVGGTDAATARGAAAHGAVFDGMRSNFFAAGGIINGRTGFNYGGGRGIMGEKGPEAILPLSRDSGGKLGVQAAPANVVVNVINNGNNNVEQKESKGPNGERILDIIITQKVKEAFASGAMDKQMSSNYGLRRRGI